MTVSLAAGSIAPAAAFAAGNTSSNPNTTVAAAKADSPAKKISNRKILRALSKAKQTSAIGALGPNADNRRNEWLASDRSITKDTYAYKARKFAAIKVGKEFVKPNGSLKEAKRQWACLDRLWWHESGWDHQTTDQLSDPRMAPDPGNSRYGIPQAYPGKKMESAGDDWRTNPKTQIKWGLVYIDTIYGTPCAAWNKWTERANGGEYGWY